MKVVEDDRIAEGVVGFVGGASQRGLSGVWDREVRPQRVVL